MIVEAIISATSGFLGWLLTLFTFDVPDWFDDMAGIFAQVVAAGYGMGVWVPWQLLLIVVSTVAGIWLTFVTVKGVRWLVGWIPTMGGS